MSIAQNLSEIKKNIPAGCTLIAVSKTKPIEQIKEAYAAGQRAFGENRAQELASKYSDLPKDIEWHMIGHLQSNKVKYIAAFVHLIHSVDSVKLLEEINRQAAKANRLVDCLLQVHIAEEETKFGFSPEEVRHAVASSLLKDLQNINVKGLMGMATFTDDQARVRREFRSLKMLFDELQSYARPARVTMEHLSMGMSGDYQIALEEGSTMVRVGTAIFGQRNRP